MARRLTHPYSAWVVIRGLTLAFGFCKLLLRGDLQVGLWLAGGIAIIWVGWLAVYPLYRARGSDSLPDDPLDPFWCRPARPSRWQRRWLWIERRRFLPVLEVGGSSILLLVSGGVQSPFHEFAQTSLVAPAMQYGVPGGALATIYFLVFYGLLLQPARPLDGLHWFLLGSPFQTALISVLLGLLVSQLRERSLHAEETSRNQERHRLIQDLHDGSAQTQYALSLKLETLNERAAQGGQIEAADWDRLLYLSRKALLETRQAMVDPDQLVNQQFDLIELFTPLTRDFQSVSGIEVHLQIEARPRLTPSERINIFRFTQEALANVFKYSRALNVHISLTQKQNVLRLEIRDDGQGYQPQSVKPGRGWSTMEKRAQSMGGRLIRWSEPNQGSLAGLEWSEHASTNR